MSRLRPVWTRAFGSSLQSTPLVAGGVLYITEPPSTVVALDARTGRQLWRHDPEVPAETLNIGFPPTNRGVALLDDSVFLGTLDARVIALDAADGSVRWTARLADNRLGYAITAAPLAVDGKVVVGMSGGEAGVRGFLDAYDAATGERVWRFWTVPAPDEPGGDTWEGDSWKTGGGATWLTGSYDPELGLLYWGVGNPAPWNGDDRAGDNLYTSSLVALEVDTGAPRWFFQFTPHDTHDWDANQVPLLVDAEWAGTRRRLLVIANKNGFFYVIDRETGEFLRATPFAKQTWADHIDENGRPVLVPGMEPSLAGPLVWPCTDGAINWSGPAYDPNRALLYLPIIEEGCRYFRTEVEYRPGQEFIGVLQEHLGPDERSGAVRAFDLATGDPRWERPLRIPAKVGILATATGLVFSGSDSGRIFALDADTGEQLWTFRGPGISTGRDARSGPISFALDGEQFVTAAAANTLFRPSRRGWRRPSAGVAVGPESARRQRNPGSPERFLRPSARWRGRRPSPTSRTGCPSPASGGRCSTSRRTTAPPVRVAPERPRPRKR